MRIIAVANQKGGCGKTTTSVNLAASLAKQGRNVLLIDMDPQGHASLGLNVNSGELERTMYNVLTPNTEKRSGLDEVIVHIHQNLDLAPANILLSAIEQELSGRPERESKLFQAISKTAEDKGYDFVIIDCSPSLGLLTFNALRASSELIAPVDTGFYSLHGISRLLETVALIEKQLKSTIKVKALVTMFDRRTRFSQEVKDEIYKYFSGRVFNTVIHNNVKLKEASSFGMPALTYDKRCRGAKDYTDLAEEVARARSVSKETVVEDLIASPAIKVFKDKERTLMLTYYSPEAQNVDIAGDFNNWVVSQESKLKSTESGIWTRVIKLEPGRYRYKFVVDGKWITDPSNPQTEKDESGNINSFLEIK